MMKTASYVSLEGRSDLQRILFKDGHAGAAWCESYFSRSSGDRGPEKAVLDAIGIIIESRDIALRVDRVDLGILGMAARVGHVNRREDAVAPNKAVTAKGVQIIIDPTLPADPTGRSKIVKGSLQRTEGCTLNFIGFEMKPEDRRKIESVVRVPTGKSARSNRNAGKFVALGPAPISDFGSAKAWERASDPPAAASIRRTREMMVEPAKQIREISINHD